MMRTTFRTATRMLALLATASAISAAEFSWQTDEAAGISDLIYDGKPVLRYQFGFDTSTPEKAIETFKVFHHVFGPGTGTLMTKGAGGHFPHHRGLYVGWNKTSYEGGSGDFWHCTNGAHQRHAKFVEQTGDADHGKMTSVIHWNAADGKPVIIETRTVSVKKIPVATEGQFGWQIDWTSQLESQRGEITLDGDRQHAGFQYRAANVVAEKNNATYLRPTGFPEEEKAFEVADATDPDKHINLGWLVMQYPVEDKTYSVGYFEDPGLPRPSRFSERPYGRFGAFFKTTLKPDQPLTMKYRVIVTADEKASREVWQQRYNSFVEQIRK